MHLVFWWGSMLVGLVPSSCLALVLPSTFDHRSVSMRRMKGVLRITVRGSMFVEEVVRIWGWTVDVGRVRLECSRLWGWVAGGMVVVTW
jgi:hypothetical protein